MTLVKWFAASFLLLGVLTAQRADACSCQETPPTPAATIRNAMATAHSVFVGTVVELSGSPNRVVVARFRVRETFKAPQAAELTVHTYRANGVGCGYRFEAGREYLVYANRDAESGKLETGFCSRTQPTEWASLEIEALRSDRLPKVPVAVRRRTVACEPCTEESIARSLACESMESCAKHEGRDLPAAGGFWSFGRDHKEKLHRITYGRTTDGRYFVSEPVTAGDQLCSNVVRVRWCESLTLEPANKGTIAVVTCNTPRGVEKLCDEASTRTATEWSEPLSTRDIRCEWDRLSAPSCYFEREPAPVGSSKPTKPGLLCESTSDRGNFWRCELVPDADTVPATDSAPR